MKKILFIVFMLLAVISNSQVIFGYHDNLLRAKDSLIVDNDFMKSADTIVFLTDVTYHEFSVDGISWSKNPSSSDKWMRVSSDAKFNWKILSLEGLEMYWLNEDGVTYTNPVYGDTIVIGGLDAEGFVLNVNGNTNSDYYFIGGDSLKLTNIYNGGGTDGQYLVLSGDTAIWQNLPSGFGETNFGRNVNTRGYGVYEGKTDTVLDFRGIASLTDMLTVTLASEDSTIDLDLALKTITTGVGLTGGTSMESDMTLNFNIPTKFPTFNDTVDVDADWWVFYDVSAGTHYKLHFSDLLGDYGFPAGGDSGQILVKLSDEDYDVGWVDPCVAIAGCSDTIISIIYDTIRVIIEEEIADVTGNINKTFARSVCNDEYTILASYFGDTIESVYISSLPDVGDLYWGADTVQVGDTLTATAGVFDSTFVYTASFDYTTAYVDAFDFKVKLEGNTGFLAQHTFYLDVSSCGGVVACVEYGYLYNWYAATDAREISSSDDWYIPSYTDAYNKFYLYLTQADGGEKIKETGEIFWDTPNNGTNDYGFNLRGSGSRSYVDGSFLSIKEKGYFWIGETNFDARAAIWASNNESGLSIAVGTLLTKTGYPIRLASDATGIPDGTTTIYEGNDGKIYPAIAINGLYWTQYNLAETLYRNGDPIPTVEDNATWAGLSTGAKCAYDNDYSYVGCDETGDELTTYPTIEYGLLYNWYAATDVKGISSSDDWVVPTETQWYVLLNYLGASGSYTPGNAVGGKAKETGFTYWDDPNTGATNEVGFNGRGGGLRSASGVFATINKQGLMWSSSINILDKSGYFILKNTDADFVRNTFEGTYGVSVRLMNPTTTLSHGETGTYTGNDGKVYKTICIGTQEWLAENLAETKYRNGDIIPEVTDNTTWSNLTTGALSAYENDWNNVGRTKPDYY